MDVTLECAKLDDGGHSDHAIRTGEGRTDSKVASQIRGLIDGILLAPDDRTEPRRAVSKVGPVYSRE